MTRSMSTPINKIEQQGIFLFRFGEKDHLELMREVGAIRWKYPPSLGEPERLVSDPMVLDQSEGEIFPSEFVFCVAGFLGRERSHLSNSNSWPPLERLVSIMLDQKRKFVRPYVMPILDSGRFLGAMCHGYISSLSRLERRSKSMDRDYVSGAYTAGKFRFICGFVDYGEVSPDNPDLRFVGQEKDRDECEFRFLGQSDLTFTWESVIQDWYPVCVPHELFQKITDLPVPTEQLLDPVWRKSLVDRMNIDCQDWARHKFNLDLLDLSKLAYELWFGQF